MTTKDLILFGLIGYALGTTISALALQQKYAVQQYVVSDLRAQLQTCNDGREEIHRMLHVMSDSVILLEKHK